MERKEEAGVGLAALAVGAGVLLYGRYVEPKWLELDVKDVPLSKKRLETPLTLLHLSDFHASRNVPFNFIEQAIDMGLGHKPDFICLTGDFITGRIDGRAIYKNLLSRLSMSAPTFACLGNHDGGLWAKQYNGYMGITEVTELLEESGVTVLTNQATDATIHQQPFRIVGLGDLYAEMARPEPRLFHGAAEDGGEPSIIVLAHNPDTKDLLNDYDWHLMLSGHGHAGQVRVPYYGAVFSPVKDQRYAEGLNEWNGRWIHTTRGVGSLYGFRLNCRPQVSVLRLA